MFRSKMYEYFVDFIFHGVFPYCLILKIIILFFHCLFRVNISKFTYLSVYTRVCSNCEARATENASNSKSSEFLHAKLTF